MSKEAEEFFRQKTIENATRPRMKKFLALVNREQEGKIMQEYADQQFRLYGVSQQRELLKAFLEHIEETVDFLPCEPSVLIDDYLKSL